MGFFSRISGFDQSRGACNAVLASYIFETVDTRLKRRAADEVLQIVGSVWKQYDRSEIAKKLSKEPRVVQSNFLALAFDNLGVKAPGKNAWWRVNNPFTEVARITDYFLKATVDAIKRDDGLSVTWPGNASHIDFVAVCGIAPTSSITPPAPTSRKIAPKTPPAPAAPPPVQSVAEPPIDEALWAQALKEYQGDQRRPGLWAASFADANGDETLTKVNYLKARVRELENSKLLANPAAIARRRWPQQTPSPPVQAGTEQQAFESPKGRCPNLSCGSVMPLDADECQQCGAIFDSSDASLQLIPLPRIKST